MGRATGRSSSNSSKQPDNEKVDSATASCPLQKNTRTPCDVASLKVEDGASGRSLEISKSNTKEPPPPGTPARILPALARYDAVLELLSAANEYTGNSKDAKEKNASLGLVAMRVGTCPLKQHVALKIEPLNAVDAQDRHVLDGNTCPAPVKVLGRALFTDKGPAKWIAPFWIFGEENIKQLKVSAESCGVLAEGKPNRALKCLVRVYRDDEYKLTFQVPAFHKFKREWKAEEDIKGTVTRESSYEHSIRGDKVAEESHKTTRSNNASGRTDYTTGKYGGKDQQGTYLAQEYGRGIKDGVAQIERTSESAERSGPVSLYRDESTQKVTSTKTVANGAQFVFDVEAQKELKPTLSLKRNGNEVDFTKAINDLINLQQRLVKSFNEIKNWVPKVGWWVEIDLSILIGEIEGSWGNRYPEKPKDGDRYKLVEQYFDLDFNLKLIDYSVSLEAGIDFKSPEILDFIGGGRLLEVILKIQGKISGEVTVKEKLTSLADDKAIRVVGESTVDINVEGSITVLAIKYQAIGGVKGGIKFEGALVGSLRVVPHIEGEFGFVETIAYAIITSKRDGDSERFEKIIFEKKEIWKGNLPSTT
ncbi:MAG: hypothetical protein HY273_11415 [Gammaproteobacteria bacterium]|nr:hypothetical protein [Gammaproteobacteria bacterium]